MTNYDTNNAGIEYTAKGEVIEENIEAEELPKHSNGDNVALRSPNEKLCWTESLGANIINLDGYFHADWRFGYDQIQLNNNRVFIVEDIEMSLILPKDELLEAAEKRAEEDMTHFAYILGGWACQALGADHIDAVSAKKIEGVFNEVMQDETIPTPDDATCEVYDGGASQ